MQNHKAQEKLNIGDVAEAAYALGEAVRFGDSADVDRAIELLRAARQPRRPALRPSLTSA